MLVYVAINCSGAYEEFDRIISYAGTDRAAGIESIRNWNYFDTVYSSYSYLQTWEGGKCIKDEEIRSDSEMLIEK